MKILLVHNRYRERGGEDVVVDAQATLLRGAGHQVLRYERDNAELDGMPAWQAAAQSLWSRRTLAELQPLLQHERPDVVHVHNSWPLVSPSVCAAAARAGVPLVATLHNYRLACPQAMFLREGRVCEDCLGRTPWPAVRHACYRGSRAQTAVLAAGLTLHRGLGTWQRGVARWLALSAFSRGKFIVAGLPAERIEVLPNFCPDPGAPPTTPRQGLLFVGRLAPEKGVHVLAQALRLAPEVMVDVIGDGPSAVLLEGLPNARRHGVQDERYVLNAMQGARALLLPSIVYENSPRVLAEALACGLPVLASASGALPELMGDPPAGWLLPPGDPAALAAGMRQALSETEGAGALAWTVRARTRYEQAFMPASHLQGLLRVYEAVRRLPA